MKAWTLHIFLFIFASYATLYAFRFWGLIPIITYYLIMVSCSYSTLNLKSKSWLWPVKIPDELMYFNKPLPSEFHEALSKLYLTYPELRTGISIVYDSYVHRKGITDKLPITYPNNLYPHIVNYLCKHNLTDPKERIRLMRDVSVWT